MQRTLVEFDGGLVDTFHDFARRKVDLDFKESARGLELSVCGGEEVVVMVTNTERTNAFCSRLQFPLRHSFQPAMYGIMWSTIVVGQLLVRVQIYYTGVQHSDK